MNIKAMRNIHLYLGCFFAPLLFFFLVSGCWQTFGLNHSSKEEGGYKAPMVLRSFSEVHTDQRWTDKQMRPEASGPFRWLVLALTLGLLATTLLGIVMAFKYTRAWLVWACLALGILIPCYLLWMARGFK